VGWGRFGGGKGATATASGGIMAGQTIWQPIIDAAEGMAARFQDPVALEGVNALDSAADCVKAVGEAFRTVGQTVLEQVYIDPRVQSAYEELGDYVLAAEDKIRDAAHSVRTAHAEEIQDIEENDPRKRAWDVSEHDHLR
jgi:hypothetical protein